MVHILCNTPEERFDRASCGTTHSDSTLIPHIHRPITSLQDLPLVMTPAEAAQALGIGRNSIYALLRSESLRSIRVGKLIKIPRAALEEYLQGY